MNLNRRDRAVLGALRESMRDSRVELTEEYVLDILRKNPDFRVAAYREVETGVREWFADLVGMDLGLGMWPRGHCSNADWEAFKSRLAQALPTRGQRYATKEDEEASEIAPFLRHLQDDED